MPAASSEQRSEKVSLVIDVLRQQLGEKINTGESVRSQHSHTTTSLPPQLPDAVVFADNPDDITIVVNTCAKYEVPVIPFGIGTSLEGQINAANGGISIDVSGMNKILSVNSEDMDCTVEPGVTREQLNSYLRDTGLFFPIDPGANATIGGMTATRASGTNAVRYGTMRENVISVEAVTADGKKIKTANRARKSSAGYDLTRLFVGSEGTLGVITAITLKLHSAPSSILSGTCVFDDIEAATNTVIMTIQMGIPVARIELMDAVQIRASNIYSDMDNPEKPTLFIELHGEEEDVEKQAEMFAEIAKDFGAQDPQFSSILEERNKLWKARHDAYWAMKSLKPNTDMITTDACVPLSRFSECVVKSQQDLAELNLFGAIIGHAGDGNFHTQVMINPDDDDELVRVREYASRVSKRAIEMDGTCTGEHGIGQGKQKYLDLELGDSVDIMRQIKKALDPKNIMNPGKVFQLNGQTK
ncbi:FAD-binding oxidoreductase [Lentilitoribacter sp. EG35]|uniref:FAD-binding oxidoreductase n=1 Tax=Lentilitoribacter sp. EG35 TaxID=3234192 RepID=UPI003460B5DA